MEPKYPVGSLVYIEKAAPETIQVGDVISFYLSDNIVATHEVFAVNDTEHQFRTRGINNVDSDGNVLVDATPVPFSSYIGKAVFDIPLLGYVYSAIKHHLIIYFAIAFLITFMLILISVKVKHNCVEETTNAKE